MMRRFNAFFSHGDAEYFLARREGRVVGRITAHVDYAYNDFHTSRTGMFGFIEFEDDQEIVDALLGAAEGWLRERSIDQMLGPMDFTINDEGGILIEGYELEPQVRQPWHPPYYRERLEQAGLVKAMDNFSWSLDVSNRDGLDPRSAAHRRPCADQVRHDDPQDEPPRAAARPGRVRPGLQRGVVAQLGVRALLQGRSRHVLVRPAARLLTRVVHGRRDRRGDRRDRDHDPRRRPDLQADARPLFPRRLDLLLRCAAGSSTGCASDSSA